MQAAIGYLRVSTREQSQPPPPRQPSSHTWSQVGVPDQRLHYSQIGAVVCPLLASAAVALLRQSRVAAEITQAASVVFLIAKPSGKGCGTLRRLRYAAYKAGLPVVAGAAVPISHICAIAPETQS